jgi:hypothetical protein
MPEHLEPGTLAYCEYGLFLPNTADATIAFTLGDMDHESAEARFARSLGATRYGLISIRNVSNGPRQPIVWSLHDTMLALTTTNGDIDAYPHLKRVIVRLLVVFFHEIREVAPELSEFSFTVANDELLH